MELIQSFLLYLWSPAAVQLFRSMPNHWVSGCPNRFTFMDDPVA